MQQLEDRNWGHLGSIELKGQLLLSSEWLWALCSSHLGEGAGRNPFLY